jgi:hypothetical protein
MKPEPDPKSGDKRPEPHLGSAEENHAEKALEESLWNLDEPLVDTDSAQDTADAEKVTENEPMKEQVVRTTLPIAPRSTRRDLVFTQSPSKKIPQFQPRSEKREESSSLPEDNRSGESSDGSSQAYNPDETFDDLEPTPAENADLDAAPVSDLPASAELDSEKDPEQEPSASNPVRELANSLSKVERIGLIGFLALVLGGLLFFLAHSVNKMPEDPKPLDPADLPIAGKIISADKITSYWREPNVSAGETARRGTLLLPVVELGVSGGPGAVRILFRDSEGAIVGDGVSRPVKGEGIVTIAATAGFDDQGMFAAYRTGETKPWKIEVLEGTSENASGTEFKKLFEIPISTQRR